MSHHFHFNLHCQEFGSPLRWCFRFSSTLTQILEAWNEELLLFENSVSDKKRKRERCKWCIRILWSYPTVMEIKKPSYSLINYCKMFTHGRAICFWFSISFTHTDMEWLVSSFCVDGRFLEDLLPCDNAGKPDCFTLINHKIQLGGDKPGGLEL